MQQVLERDGLLARTRDTGDRFQALLRQHFAAHPHVGDIRGRGLFVGIELVVDRATKAGFEHGSHLPGALRQNALAEGLVCYPGGIDVDGRTVPHVMLAPPMTAEDAHLDMCVERLERVLDRVLPAGEARRAG